ncbi:hypothetical protein ACFV2H_34050 [Streptomyces sp. NPDC059629]|uniref:hypothetical protein n=1 Tax=Streptomyces sp. NPDC059629 TaxID=3346889 RepID=UPI0036B0C223
MVDGLLASAGVALGAVRLLLAVAVVLASLYAAIPPVLGVAVLREKLTRAQAPAW